MYVGLFIVFSLESKKRTYTCGLVAEAMVDEHNNSYSNYANLNSALFLYHRHHHCQWRI